MRTIAIDAWNQTGINEVSQTCRSAATGQERNDADIKVAILKKTISFEPGILKREGKESRLNKEVGSTLRSQMGDNQTAVMSLSAKPGEMIRLSDSPKTSKEVSNTLTRSDGKLGDNQPTVVAFAQNTRDEVRVVGQDKTNPQSAILNHSTTTNTNTENKLMKAEVRRLTPMETSRLMGMPDDHLAIHGENTSDSCIYSCNGNGWARNCSRLVFKNIHKVDEKITGGKRAFKIGSVSSGQGTHEMSVQDFGDVSIFCADIAPFPCAVLKTRFPDMPNFGDVTRISYDSEKKVIHNRKKTGYYLMSEDQLGFKPVDAETHEIPLEYGELDCVSGGLPCTDVSVAGKRAGAEEGSGTRSALAYELPRIGKDAGSRRKT